MSAYFNGEAQLRLYHDLREHRDAIEAEVGSKLVWTHGPDHEVGRDRAPQPRGPDRRGPVADLLRLDAAVAGDASSASSAPASPKLDARSRRPEAPGDPSATGALQAGVLDGAARPADRRPEPREAPQAAPPALDELSRSAGRGSTSRPRSLRTSGGDRRLPDPRAVRRPSRISTCLLKDRDAIEQELGTELEWRELPAKKQSHVVLRRTGVDPTRPRGLARAARLAPGQAGGVPPGVRAEDQGAGRRGIYPRADTFVTNTEIGVNARVFDRCIGTARRRRSS